MKSAFEQVYGPPYLARMLFAEVGSAPAKICFYAWSMTARLQTNGAMYAQVRQDFAVLSGTRQSGELMEAFLKSQQQRMPALKRH